MELAACCLSLELAALAPAMITAALSIALPAAVLAVWSAGLETVLAAGAPSGQLPHLSQRQQNFMLVRGSKYAAEADLIAKQK